MRIIQFFIYLLYRFYYRTSGSFMAYEAALMVLTLFITLNILFIPALLGLDLINFVFRDDDTKIIQYAKSFVLMAPLYLGLSLRFKKQVVAEMKYDETKLKKGYVFLVLYLFLSLIVIVFAALRKDIIRMYFSHH